MSEATTAERAGWGLPNHSHKWHYFRDSMSLCRKFGFYFGPLEQGNDNSADNCAACKKLVANDRLPNSQLHIQAPGEGTRDEQG